MLYGKLKNIIIPAVKLLKTDHCANNATPIKVTAAPIKLMSLSVSTPHKIMKKIKNKILKKELIYFNTNLLRFSAFSEILDTFKIILLTNNRNTYRIINKIIVAIIFP